MCVCVCVCLGGFALQVPVHTVTLDLRDLTAVAQMPGQLPDAFKEVDILVNNAGLALGVASVGHHNIEVGKRGGGGQGQQHADGTVPCRMPSHV